MKLAAALWDANGHPLPDGQPVIRTVTEAVDACYSGHRAHALKRGRNHRWPYVPVVVSDRRDIRRTDLTTQSQIRGKAFETREQALAYAQRVIDFRRDRFRDQLLDPAMRLIRDQWGVPHAVVEGR